MKMRTFVLCHIELMAENNHIYSDFGIVEADNIDDAIVLWAFHFNMKVKYPIAPSSTHSHCYVDCADQYILIGDGKQINQAIKSHMEDIERNRKTQTFIG